VRYYLLLFVLFTRAALFTENQFQLKNLLGSCEEGNYIVSYQNKAYTLLNVFEKEGDALELEEITVPSQFKQKDLSWKEWMSGGAAGHTSRVMYRLDSSTGTILAYYSFTEGAWLSVDPEQNILSQLISIHLEKVPDAERRRRGPRPTDGPDRRPIWNPPLVVEGKRESGALFSAWRGRWPRDGSELADKEILVYLPDGAGSYLPGFPYWLEISGGIGRAHFRVIDSGEKMISPFPKARLGSRVMNKKFFLGPS
jgi:hypothetical protein